MSSASLVNNCIILTDLSPTMVLVNVFDSQCGQLDLNSLVEDEQLKPIQMNMELLMFY